MSEEKKSKKNFVVFLDTVGRTIIAEKKDEGDDTISVKNPALVNIVPQHVLDPNTGQPVLDANGQPVQRMALQLFPLFFREFLAAKDEPICFTYNKKNITLAEGEIALDFKVGIQYDQLFAKVGDIQPVNNQAQPPVNPQPQPQPQQEEQKPDDNVINLFDD